MPMSSPTADRHKLRNDGVALAILTIAVVVAALVIAYLYARDSAGSMRAELALPETPALPSPSQMPNPAPMPTPLPTPR